NITISIVDTTDIGGVAQGVLGVYETGGSIMIVGGWNLDTGANPARIGGGQYDFQTVVTHELGHALGFGHSDDPNSPMFESLPTGVTRRTLTAADLHVIDQAARNAGSNPVLAPHQTPTASGHGIPAGTHLELQVA